MFFASNLRGLVNFFPTSSLVQLKVSTRSQLTVFEEVKNFLNLLRRKKLVRLQVHQDISFKSDDRIALAKQKEAKGRVDAFTVGQHCGTAALWAIPGSAGSALCNSAIFVIFYSPDTDIYCCRGYCIDLLRLLSEECNFTYNLVREENHIGPLSPSSLEMNH